MNCGGEGSFLCSNPECRIHPWEGQAKARLEELQHDCILYAKPADNDPLPYLIEGANRERLLAQAETELEAFIVYVADRRAHRQPLVFQSILEEPAILAATKWWADQLRVRREDRLLDRLPSKSAMLAMDILRNKRPATSAQLETFTGHLAKYLRETIAMDNSCMGSHFFLTSEHDNKNPLIEALKAAGISKSQLPPKTRMFVYPQHVLVTGGKNGILIYGNEATCPRK